MPHLNTKKRTLIALTIALVGIAAQFAHAINYNVAGGSNAGPFPLAAGGNTITTNNNNATPVNPAALNGLISGNGNLTFTTTDANNSVRIAQINVASTYTGSTTIRSNDSRFGLRIGLNNALPTGTVLTINPINVGSGRPDWFDLNGFSQELAGITNTTAGAVSAIVNGNTSQAGSLIVNNSSNFTYSAFLGPDNAHSNITSAATGILDGQGNNFSLTKKGTGILTLTKNNSYTGATIVSGGELRFGHASALSTTSAITLAGGTTLTKGTGGNMNSATIDAPITVGNSGTTATIALNAKHSSGAPNAATLTLNGPISGAGNVTFQSIVGSNTYSTVVLNAQSTYAGSTLFTTTLTNSQILVNLGIDNALPTTTVLTMDGGNGAGSGRQTVLNLNGHDQTLAGLTNVTRNLRTQKVRNTSGTYATLTIDNASNYNFSGLLGSGGANLGLTKDGTGTFTLSGNNTYTGATAVNAGELRMGHASALSNTSSITLAGGTTLTKGTGGNMNSATIDAPITVGNSGTTATIALNAKHSSGAPNAATLTLNGPISGAGNVTFQSIVGSNTYSTVVLNAQSTYAGSTLFTTTLTNSQILVNLGIDNALPTTTVLTMDGGNGAGSGRQTVLNLNGHDQTLAGLTNVTRNLRTQKVRNTSGTYATLTIDNASNYNFSGLLGSGGANLGLTKDGTGTFTLSGNNTYTGATAVNAGELIINGNTSGQGDFTVASGARLGGDGSIGANVIVANAHGELSPGDKGSLPSGSAPSGSSPFSHSYSAGTDFETVGTLNVDGDVDLGGFLLLDIMSMGHDLLNVTGEFSIDTNPNAQIEINGTTDLTEVDFWGILDWTAPGPSIDLVTFSTFGGGEFDNIAFGQEFKDAGGHNVVLGIDSDSIFLVATPEPASIAIWTLLGLGLAGLGYYRARRNK